MALKLGVILTQQLLIMYRFCQNKCEPDIFFFFQPIDKEKKVAWPRVNTDTELLVTKAMGTSTV